MSLFACFGSRRKREPLQSRGVDFWDCSNLGLSDLPKEVLKHRRTLQKLVLTCNNIKDVPKTLFTFEILTELDLSENVILFLPPSIRALRSLTTLNISKNSLSTLPDSIRECQDLLHLDISANSLGSLPDGLMELRQLRTLSLNDCQLEELPANIGKLSKLEILELRENLINTLPQSMCHLTLLETLDLGVNEIEAVMPVIGTLESLSELWLDGNLLNTLPDEIGSLRNLKFLEVSENQLMFLPLSIAGLVSLQDLHLSDNLLTLLPDTMGELKSLKMLKMERNRLTALPQTMAGWTSLVELSASQNFLEEIPTGVGALRHLENLNFDENSLFSLPSELGRLSRLKIFSLRGNNLTELPNEIGELESLSILNVVGNRLQFLPYSITTLTKLTAVWIAENQNRPLLDLQLTRSGDGQKMITCILLPQEPSESPFSSRQSESPPTEQKTHPTAVNFDPKVQDRKSNLTRDPTPYPKELHIKALQWRAAREEAASSMAPDRTGINSEVTLRSSGRTKALHRPYSLIRAMSDPIDQDLTSPPQSRPGSRKRDHSRERREASRSPCLSHSSHPAPFIRGGSDRSRREERPISGSFQPSPSPPPLAQPYTPEHHQRHEVVEVPGVRTNGPQVHENKSMSVSPFRTSPSDDYHAALLANTNSNNGNCRPAVPVPVPVAVAVKSNTFPLAQSSWHASTSPTSVVPLQSSAQGQSEASTLSRSDAPNPRFSSSAESGFDADMEQDPTSHWYITDTLLKQKGSQGYHRRLYGSDSSRPYVAAGSQIGRRGSAGDDYDHLYRIGGQARQPHQKNSLSSSPLTNGGSHMYPHHQKATRSFDNTEGDIVSSVTTTITHRSSKGSQSSSHLSSHSVNPPQSPRRLEEGRGNHTGPLVGDGRAPPGQRVAISPRTSSPVPVSPSNIRPHHQYQNVSYFTDNSKSSCPEQTTQAMPKNTLKTYGGPSCQTSQDSGFDSIKRDPLSGGTIIKVELMRNPSLGLGIKGIGEESETDKPANMGYHVYKIVEGSPASLCGKIKIGDKIIEINGVEVSSLDLVDIIAFLETETRIVLTLYRESSVTLL